MSKTLPPTAPAKSKTSPEEKQRRHSHNGTREFIESVVIAIVLALMFRTFEAEAFVIPTGSMAPTLMGRHKDVTCSECGQPYQTTASGEDKGQFTNTTTCPNCHFPMELNPAADPNQQSFSGDRILVSKFAYEIADPERWDVIVFKYPGNAKQNYIKRLIGLPGEAIRVTHGDIYIRQPEEKQFRIAQRSPDKIRAMLQLVHDNDHQSTTLNELGWPQRWHNSASASNDTATAWQQSDDFTTFAVTAGEGSAATLHYRHTPPTPMDWSMIAQGKLPRGANDSQGRLITDFCGYNAFYEQYDDNLHWVGDLGTNFQLNVASGESGQFTCELVEAGVRYQCTFDLTAGKATLHRSDDQAVFHVADKRLAAVTATSPIAGAGDHEIRMANVNDSICVWVDGEPLTFADAGTVVQYDAPTDDRPHWSPDDPGDLAPVRLTAEGMQAEVTSLQVLRDVYYVAIDRTMTANDDYDFPHSAIRSILNDPKSWSQTELFASRRAVEFQINADEFFPMGDNSPQSLDARLWSIPPAPRPAVPRELMIGKALMVYWPHTWSRPIPFTPNPEKMRLIK